IVFVGAYAGPALSRWGKGRFKVEFVFAAIVLVALGTARKVNSPLGFADVFAEMESRTSDYLHGGTMPSPWRLIRFVELLSPGGKARASFAEDVKRLPRAIALQTLREAGVPQARRGAVFVPPENAWFWTYRDCRAVSMFIP